MSRTRRKRRARKTRRKRTQRGGETRREKEEKKEKKEEEKHREKEEKKEKKEEEKHREKEEEKDEHCKSGKNGCLACNDEGHCTACDIGYLRHEGSCKRMQKPSALKDKEDEMKEEMSDKVGESIKEKMSSHVPGMEGAEDAFGEVKGLGGTGMEGVEDAFGEVKGLGGTGMEGVEDIAGEVKGLGGTGIEGVEDIAGEVKGLGGGVTDMVSKAESKVMAGGEEAELEAACEVVGLGPEDPLADACAALVAAGFTLTPKIKNLAEDGALPGVSWPKSNSLPSVGIPKLPFHMPHLHFPHFHMPHLHFPHFNIHIPKIFQFKRHPWLWPRDGQCPSPLPWNDPTASSYQDIPPDQDVPPVQGGGRRRKRKTRRKTRRKKRRKTRRKKRRVRRKTRRR